MPWGEPTTLGVVQDSTIVGAVGVGQSSSFTMSGGTVENDISANHYSSVTVNGGMVDFPMDFEETSQS